MESSSNDSFLWADASNESNDNINDIRSLQAMVTDYDNDISFGNPDRNQSKQKRKKTKKRKYSETTQDDSDNTQVKRKRVKLEVESDVDIGKMEKFAINNTHNSESQDSDLYDENYLNLRVKKEQSSSITSEIPNPRKKKKRGSDGDIDNNTESENYIDLRVKQEQSSSVIEKRKKHKKQSQESPSNADNTCDSESTVQQTSESYLDSSVKDEQYVSAQTKKKTKKKKHKRSTDYTYESDCTIKQNDEHYLDMHVKEEQTSLSEPVVNTRKKRKRQKSIESSELDIASIANPVIKVSDTTVESNSSTNADQTYCIVEEKFSADETVVEKPRKKKKSKNVDNESMYDKEENEKNCELYTDSIIDNDKSLQPSDFTCNNIVSSTIINSSTIDLIENKHKTTDTSSTHNRSPFAKKISERIRFEEDESSSQPEPGVNTTSVKINTILKTNPQLQLCNVKAGKCNTITNVDEIWSLRLPYKINLDKIENTTLSLEEKCKIKIDGNIYEGVPNENVNRITLLIHQNGQTLLTNLLVNKCIDYHKKVPKANNVPDGNIMVNNHTNFIPLPETKCRHPLFGAQYKKSIKIPAKVVENLNAAKQKSTQTQSKTSKPKKHKKNRHKLDNIKVEEDHKPLKKKRKRIVSEDDDGVEKRHKRVKLETDSTAVWESEQAIEENLFNY